MGDHTASIIQNLVYRHPNGMPSSDQIIMPISSRRPTDIESPLGSSRSGDTPLGHDYPSENESSMLARKGEAQSWTFEEQFRQVREYTHFIMDSDYFIWLYLNNDTIYLVQCSACVGFLSF